MSKKKVFKSFDEYFEFLNKTNKKIEVKGKTKDEYEREQATKNPSRKDN